MAVPGIFLGCEALLGTVAESTYGTTPSPATIAALTSAFVFVSERVKKHGNLIQRSGMRGFRDHVGDDSAVGPYTCGGQIVLEPTPVDLNWWLTYILGSGPSSHAYALAETLPSFSLGIARGPKNFRYAGCNVNRAVLAGSKGGLVRLTLDLVAQTENLDTATWPAIAADVSGGYVFNGMVSLTVNSIARPINDFELTIDNHLITDRFFNSATIVNAPADDRTIRLRATLPWNATNEDLYDQGVPGYTGATLAFSNGTNTFTAAFGELQAAADSPTAAQRAENLLTMDWMVLRTGTTPSLAVTSD